METIDLYESAKVLLQQSSESVPTIADNAGVNPHWLGKFKQGKYANPGVRTVQRLHDYLLSKQEEQVA